MVGCAAPFIGALEVAPRIHRTAWLAPGAVVLGGVTIAGEASVWYHAVVRADTEAISIGVRSNIQDGAVLHADPGFPIRIAEEVSVGHNAVVHGATVGRGSLIGMGATIMNGSVIGSGSLIAAGAVVPESMHVPPGSLVAGVPARVRRSLTGEEGEALLHNAARYVALAGRHRAVVARS